MWGGEMGFFWIFALLLLPGLFNGGAWGGRNGEPVTESGLCNAMNANNLENAVGRLSDTVQAGQRQTDNAVCQLGYQALNLANQNQRDLCTGFTSVTGAINQARFENQQCCCDTQKLIQQGQYQDAMNTAAINANTTAQTQKILDAICGNRMADMQNQINQLQLRDALCGVIRYPTSTTFNAGFNPFFGGYGGGYGYGGNWNDGCGCNRGCC